MITNEVVNQAIDYIMQHIEEEITIEQVANYCHFSKFYFSRIFKEETGESLYAFIKRVRVEQSAFKLKIEPYRTITDIGYEYGYTPSNYSSVFKQHRNESPANFRRNIVDESLNHPFFHKEENTLKTLEECKKLITIETLPDMKVIYERRKGNYHNLGNDWCAFLEKYHEYQTADTLLIERTFDDPAITDMENCLYDICMTAPDDCKLENITTINGGKFAIYHFNDHVSSIYASYQSFFNVWFPNNHYEIDNRYGYDIYHDVDCETGNIKMDICFPIK